MERPGRGAGHEADLSEGSQRMYLGPRGRGCCAAAEQGASGDAKCMVRSLHVHMVPFSCASSCRNTQRLSATNMAESAEAYGPTSALTATHATAHV